MSTVLLYGFVFVVALAASAAVYYLALTRFLPRDPLASEVHAIPTGDGWTIKLHRYRPAREPGEPVFICHGFSSNHWNFALPAGAALVDTLVGRGYDCWLIDLRGNRGSLPPAGTGRHEATIDGYLLEDIPAAIQFIREETGHERVHWVGHSMGGLLLYAYEQIHGRDRIASGTTLGAPPGFRRVFVHEQGRLLGLIKRSPKLCEIVLRALSPLVPLFRIRTRLLPVNWGNMHAGIGPRAFFDLAELPSPAAAEALLDCALYGRLRVDHDRVDALAGLNTLQTPLLIFQASLDPLATLSNVRAFFDALPSDDKRLVEMSELNGCSADYDHVDLAFSRRGAEEVYEPIAEWIGAHAMARPAASAAPSRGPAWIPSATLGDGEPAAADRSTPEAPVGAAPQTTAAETAPPEAAHWQERIRATLKASESLMADLDGDGAVSADETATPAAAPRVRRKAAAAKAKTGTRKKRAAKKLPRRKSSARRTSVKKATSKQRAVRKRVTKKAARKKSKKKAGGDVKAAKKKKAPSKKGTLRKAPAKKKPTKKPSRKKSGLKGKKATVKKGAARKRPNKNAALKWRKSR